MGSIRGVPRGKYKKNTIRINGEVYCSNCNKKYKKRSSLLQHIKANHFNVRKICPICSKKFNYVSTLNRHHRNDHGNDTTIHANSRASCVKKNTKHTVNKKSKNKNCDVNNMIDNNQEDLKSAVMVKSEPPVCNFKDELNHFGHNFYDSFVFHISGCR